MNRLKSRNWISQLKEETHNNLTIKNLMSS